MPDYVQLRGELRSHSSAQGICALADPPGIRGIGSEHQIAFISSVSPAINLLSLAMRMSQASLYAIRAALQLCKSDVRRPTPCSELARREQISVRFLNQILGKLVKRGVLTSTIGASGGYALSRAPEDITLLELIVEFEHDIATDIVESPGPHDKSHRLLLTTLGKIFDAVFRELEKVSLADLQRLSTSQGTPRTEQLGNRSDQVHLLGVDVSGPDPSYLFHRTNS